MLQKSIDELSIWAFNQIARHNDTGYMYAPYQSASDESAAAYDNIVEQYAQATAHREDASTLASLLHARLLLQIEYDSVKAACTCLQYVNDSRMVAIVEQYGYEINNPDDIARVLHQITALQTDIREIDIEILRKTTKKTTEKPVTFEIIVHRISTYYKVHYDTKQISVGEWIAIEDNFLTDLKQSHARNRETASRQ
jgi:hypothetical protein